MDAVVRWLLLDEEMFWHAQEGTFEESWMWLGSCEWDAFRIGWQLVKIVASSFGPQQKHSNLYLVVLNVLKHEMRVAENNAVRGLRDWISKVQGKWNCREVYQAGHEAKLKQGWFLKRRSVVYPKVKSPRRICLPPFLVYKPATILSQLVGSWYGSCRRYFSCSRFFLYIYRPVPLISRKPDNSSCRAPRTPFSMQQILSEISNVFSSFS